MKDMIAKQELRYGGRNLRAGDPFEAPDRDANLLRLIGKAEYAAPAKVAPSAPAAPEKEPAGAEPMRDEPASPSVAAGATSDDTAAEPAADAAEAPPTQGAPAAPRRRRQYRRRDLSAEE